MCWQNYIYWKNQVNFTFNLSFTLYAVQRVGTSGKRISALLNKSERMNIKQKINKQYLFLREILAEKKQMHTVSEDYWEGVEKKTIQLCKPQLGKWSYLWTYTFPGL